MYDFLANGYNIYTGIQCYIVCVCTMDEKSRTQCHVHVQYDILLHRSPICTGNELLICMDNIATRVHG
jgi:hypothetical protein